MRSLIVASLVVAIAGCAELDQTLKQLPQGVANTSTLGDARIGAALKEALQVGTENAVRLTGRPDGYFRNEAIKILLPEQLRSLEKSLRAVGFGPQVDDLVLGMNRAAERAAPQAKQIFWDAIGAMTIDDARSILGGADTAATDYFEAKTSDALTRAFRPIVETSMREVGVTRQYTELYRRAQAIPFLNVEAYDLDRYVVTRALDGLFHVVGEEEKKIRTNPAARVTELLRDVFGRR
ncbi:MAG TPA: DUF4197 domain-containing protein [Methylomirabilota bacterium]|nr:DUF4197 domain-containing protein [Methylomirabilota bacterium]